MKINLLDEFNTKTNIFRFHIQKNILHYFFTSNNNKSFLFYLIILELSNKKGFCYLKTREISDYFKIKTPKTICNWLKELNNNNLINASYNEVTHFWDIQINTFKHINLWKQYKEKHNEEPLNIEITQDVLENIIFQEELLENEDKDISDEDSLISHTNTDDNLIEGEDSMSKNEITKEEYVQMSNDLKMKYDSDALKNIAKMFNLFEMNKNKKILIVTPYKTHTKENIDDTNYTLTVIKHYEEFARNYIDTFVGQSVSPIYEAQKQAQKEIKEKNIVDTNEQNKIIQTYLNNINFLDENIIKDVDLIAVSIVNYHNLNEIMDIEKLAQKLEKEIKYDIIPCISCLDEDETKMKLEQIKNNIDDKYFYIKSPQNKLEAAH